MALDPARQATDCQLTSSSRFERFLRSDTFLEYRFGPKVGGGWRTDTIADTSTREKKDGRVPPCLLDLIDVWVVLGDATEVCTTFESFLLTIIQIADWWDNGNTGATQRSVEFTLLWPDTLGLDGQDDPGPEIAFGPYRMSEGEDDHNALAVNHPVLNRGRWEAIRAARLLNT